MEKWYRNLYRRNLVDMHIADWDEAFLSQFDIDRYVEYLKIAKIQSPMIYLQAHTGLCNYPTKTARMHNAFQNHPYKIRELIEKCKANGMTPVGYYSLIFNNWAEDEHPEWAMRNYKGETWREQSGVRYGLCCPNNPQYREFAEAQIEELSKIFDLDAVFFDMPYWEMLCECDSCKKKWKERYDTEMPVKEDWHDPEWLRYIRMRQVWMGDFVKFIEKTAKKYMPDTTVEFNYAAVIGCDWLGGSTELVNDGCEFASGDLYGDIYSHSFACKYYSSVTKNQPFEYMTSRCDPNLREHTVLKSENRLTREVLLTTAHHGSSLIIDAIDPVGTLDRRVYERVGKVFQKQIPHEKYFTGRYVADAAVFFDSTTQFSSDQLPFSNKWSCVNALKKLVENHVLCDVVSNATAERFGNYDLIIAPCLEDFENDSVLKLIDYVKNGGKLILSGKSESRLMRAFFGATFCGFTNEDIVYMRPTESGKSFLCDFSEAYPAPVKYKMPVYQVGNNAQVLAELTLPGTDPHDNGIYTSIHSNPPWKKSDIPCLLKAKYGLGEVIWCGAAAENDSRESYENFFMNCVNNLLRPEQRSLYFEGSPKIECTLFQDGTRYILHCIDLYEDENLERTYRCVLPADCKISKVYNGETLEDIAFQQKDGAISFGGTFNTFITIIAE